MSPLSPLELSALAVRLVTVDGHRVDDPPTRPTATAPNRRPPTHTVFATLRSVLAELRAADSPISPSATSPSRTSP